MDRKWGRTWLMVSWEDKRGGFADPDRIWRREWVRVENGWPWRTLRGESRWAETCEDRPRMVERADSPSIRCRVPWTAGQDAWLPVVPAWPGFGASAVMLGALAWGVWRGVGAARGLARRCRGRCPQCAYDRAGLAASATCPECGHEPLVPYIVELRVRGVAAPELAGILGGFVPAGVDGVDPVQPPGRAGLIDVYSIDYRLGGGGAAVAVFESGAERGLVLANVHGLGVDRDRVRWLGERIAEELRRGGFTVEVSDGSDASARARPPALGSH